MNQRYRGLRPAGLCPDHRHRCPVPASMYRRCRRLSRDEIPARPVVVLLLTLHCDARRPSFPRAACVQRRLRKLIVTDRRTGSFVPGSYVLRRTPASPDPVGKSRATVDGPPSLGDQRHIRLVAMSPATIEGFRPDCRPWHSGQLAGCRVWTDEPGVR